MKAFGLLLVVCALMGACTVIDGGVLRGADEWKADFGANGYMEFGWPANDTLLSVDLIGGPNDFTLIRADLWRLLHLELGLLGAGIGLGPLQIGGGFGLYAPGAPAAIMGDNPFHEPFGK